MKIRKWGIALLLLLSLVVLTGCDGTTITDTIPYAESRTAAVFSAAGSGRVKMDFSVWIFGKEVKCALSTELSRQLAQIEAVRNAHDVYQRDEGNRSYTIDVGKYKEYSEEERKESGVLGMAKVLAGGVDNVKVGTGMVNDQTYYCETLQTRDVKVICYYEGAELKHILIRVLGAESTGEVHGISYTVPDSEFEIKDFPAGYTKVEKLKDIQSVNPFY